MILGVGNTLLGDEGFGVYVVRELESRGLPAGVQVVEGGVGGFALLDVLTSAPNVILVDAADMGMEPGTLKRFTLDDADPESCENKLSLHQVGLADVLQMARALGCEPDLVIVGFQPATISPGDGISPIARSKLSEAVQMVLDEVTLILTCGKQMEGV